MERKKVEGYGKLKRFEENDTRDNSGGENLSHYKITQSVPQFRKEVKGDVQF